MVKRRMKQVALALSIVAAASVGAAVLYANGHCPAGGSDKAVTQAAVPAQCASCAALQKGQLCATCTAHKLGLSEEEAKKLASSIETYNKKVAKAQEELIAAAKKEIGEEKAAQLAASLQKPHTMSAPASCPMKGMHGEEKAHDH